MVAREVVRHREQHPVVARVALVAQHLLRRRDEALRVAQLQLDVAEVAADAQVAGVDAHRLPVALGRLRVVAVGAVQQAVDVPAGVRLDVGADGGFREVVRLLPALGVVGHDEALERQRLAVLGVLLEDLRARVAALSLAKRGLADEAVSHFTCMASTAEASHARNG